MKNNLKRHAINNLFGQFSANYDQHMVLTNHFNVQKILLERLKGYIGNNICDIACGTGAVPQILDNMVNANFTLVDFQKDMIKIAQNKLGFDRFKYKQCDVHNLAKLNKTYNTITCCFGFYWFIYPEKVVSGLSKVLSNNGTIIILEEHFFNNVDTLPSFKNDGNNLASLAQLENYIGIVGIKKVFKYFNFNLTTEVREPIDNRHELCGLVFNKKVKLK